MKTIQPQTKITPQFKLADSMRDLQPSLKTNPILEKLEENIKLREMPIELRLKKQFLQ